MKVRTLHFGNLADGREAVLFRFECESGLEVAITNFGGIITSIKMPDRFGKKDEISAGFPNLQQYLDPHPYFGSIVGPYAGRIAEGKMTIDRQTYQLERNSGNCHLHGGSHGLHSRLWSAKLIAETHSAQLNLNYTKPHLESNYPGNVAIQASYILSDDNRIRLKFKAETDLPTHLNLTNHAYFNLNGFRNTVADHCLKINAQRYVELNEELLPTGRLNSLDGSVYDFREKQCLQSRQIPQQHELDHCYVLDNGLIGYPAVECSHPQSGRYLHIFTSQPGIQVYSANFLDGSLAGHNGQQYEKHSAICFETQHFADTPNQNTFPSTLLYPGEIYSESTDYIFDVKP